MKRMLTSLAFAALAAAAGLPESALAGGRHAGGLGVERLAATPAFGDRGKHRRDHGGFRRHHRDHKAFRHHGRDRKTFRHRDRDRKAFRHRDRDRKAFRHRDRGHRAFRHRHRGLHLGHRLHRAPACHRVSQLRFDGHGHRILVRSLQCYDRFGRPYIVPGSRFVTWR